LIFEDSIAGMKSARNAGAGSVVAAAKTIKSLDQTAALADYHVHRLSDFFSLKDIEPVNRVPSEKRAL
tara:strand:+ start:81198 stop:81401 length:204 start_codon:yes stop_codon:yes gene_type:complete